MSAKPLALHCAVARGKTSIGLIAALLLFAGTALAEEKEPVAALVLGTCGAAPASVPRRQSSSSR
jgi:hypothetical protein